jgi:hypothetical protein
MSGPEWRNVEIAEEFAQFLKEGHSIFKYPYFSQIYDMWKCYYQSYKVARKYDSDTDIITSEYMVMDAFVAFFTTLELLPKGVLSLFLSPFMKAENNTEVQTALAAYFEKYASDLQTIPFYDQAYAAHRERLIQAYQSAHQKTWGDWFSYKLVSAELWARHWISKPLYAWFHSDTNVVTPKTDILVEMRGDDGETPAHTKRVFRQKIGQIADLALVKKTDTNEVDDGEAEENECLYTETATDGDAPEHTNVYALLRASRYGHFQQEITELAAAGISVKKIAGQSQVQVKCELDVVPEQLLSQQEQLVPHARLVYSYGDRIHPNRRICLFDVPVEHLQETVAAFNAQDHVKVNFIHNF